MKFENAIKIIIEKPIELAEQEDSSAIPFQVGSA
jgi:hypothetical protein